MSVWTEIDKLKARYDREFAVTSAAIESEGGVKGSLRADEFGRWSCRYIPASDRSQGTLTAKSGAELVQQLKDIRKREAAKAKPLASR